MKIQRLTLLILFLFFLSGCTAFNFNTTIKIVTPQNLHTPLEGSWQVEKTYKQDLKIKSKLDNNNWAGKKVEFSKDAIMLGEYFWTEPVYKIKKVESEGYLFSYPGEALQDLQLDNKELEVYTVTSEDKFLYEFIKLNADEMLVNVDGTILRLKKVSKDVDSEFYSKIKNRQSSKSSNTIDALPDNSVPAGIVLGIRSEKKIKSDKYLSASDEYTYKTLWVAYDYNGLRPILRANNLLLPRKSNFWEVYVKGLFDKNGKKDFLLSHSLLMENSTLDSILNIKKDEFKETKGNICIKILYAGNDYLSLESAVDENSSQNNFGLEDKHLWLQPVDNVLKLKALKLSDISGDSGSKAFEKAKGIELSKKKNSVLQFDETNFKLLRRMGHWVFNGRYENIELESKKFTDFNINLIPPTKLTAFDTLWVTWTQVTDKVPDATDVFTSPTKNIAIIQTKDKLLIYLLNNGILADSPLKKIKLAPGDSIVMSEWATGDYVDKWEKVLLMSSAIKI